MEKYSEAQEEEEIKKAKKLKKELDRIHSWKNSSKSFEEVKEYFESQNGINPDNMSKRSYNGLLGYLRREIAAKYIVIDSEDLEELLESSSWNYNEEDKDIIHNLWLINKKERENGLESKTGKKTSIIARDKTDFERAAFSMIPKKAKNEYFAIFPSSNPELIAKYELMSSKIKGINKLKCEFEKKNATQAIMGFGTDDSNLIRFLSDALFSNPGTYKPQDNSNFIIWKKQEQEYKRINLSDL